MFGNADDCHSLDVWRMQRAGCLVPGSFGSWVWRRGEEVMSQIGYRCLSTGALELRYTVTRTDQHYRDVIWTETAAMRHGKRVYWRCPSCGRRVQKLYMGGTLFRCRHCYDLSYASRQDRNARGDWLFGKRDRLEAELAALPPRASPRRRYRLWLEQMEVNDRLNLRLTGFLEASNRRLARLGISLGDAGDRDELAALRATPPPKLPRGRPKEKRAYTRRAPLPALTPATSTPSAYCVRCRDRRRLLWARPGTLANGRPVLRGRCAVCKTRLARILPG